jgi:beta-glucosidase
MVVVLAFRDPSRSFAQRADDLLGRLTGDEKIAMLHQRALPVPRLGIEEFFGGAEGVHGASWRDHEGTGMTMTATVFPQPAGLAAAWDPDLAREVGQATARELRALHGMNPAVGLNVWAPVVNLLRDPRWGRNEEGYSEDPLLTAAIAVAFCRGLSGDVAASSGYLLTAPTLKHFLGYNNEDYRDLTSSALRPRVLREYDLPPFRAPVEAGVATGVMPSYNLVNGRPMHVSPLLAMIRTWTGEELLTCSDAFAPSNLVNTEHYFDDHAQAHAAALRAGLDSFTDQGGDGTFTTAAVRDALDRGLITMAEVDRAVRRKLLIRLRLGEFDPDGGPYATAGVLGSPAHRDLAATAARRGMVLLKNDNALLPLAADAGERIAVIGPLADTLCEDWYSPAMPYQVTIADGIRAAAAPGNVTLTEAADRVRTDLGEFDVFDWGEDVVTLRQDGKYLTVRADGSLAVEADRPDGWVVRETFRRIGQPGGDMLLRSTATGAAQRLRWDVLDDGVAAAVAAARAADVAVLVAGNHPLIGAREPRDRSSLRLPAVAERLIREVSAANPRTVLVLMSSFPYALDPDGIPAIMWTCHGGQETGRALAALLFGEHAPEGRLTQTWYRSDAQLPSALDYDIIKAGWTYQYFGGEPLYPFGHGLGYTTFGYDSLELELEQGHGGTVVASVTVTNTGEREGTEVVQLYARYAAPGYPRRRLCGFGRITLTPGMTATVEIPVPAGRLACWDTAAHRMTLPPGKIEILAGGSSGDVRQAVPLTLRAPAPAPRRLDATIAAADFDDYQNITLTDVSREAGEAVTPADPARPATVLFRNTIIAERTAVLTFRVSCADPQGGRIEVRGPAGTLHAQAEVPCTGDRYRWADVTAPLLSPPGGPADLSLVLAGRVRLASFAAVLLLALVLVLVCWLGRGLLAVAAEDLALDPVHRVFQDPPQIADDVLADGGGRHRQLAKLRAELDGQPFQVAERAHVGSGPATPAAAPAQPGPFLPAAPARPAAPPRPALV